MKKIIALIAVFGLIAVAGPIFVQPSKKRIRTKRNSAYSMQTTVQTKCTEYRRRSRRFRTNLQWDRQFIVLRKSRS